MSYARGKQVQPPVQREAIQITDQSEGRPSKGTGTIGTIQIETEGSSIGIGLYSSESRRDPCENSMSSSYAEELSTSDALFDGRRNLTFSDVGCLANQVARLKTDGRLKAKMIRISMCHVWLVQRYRLTSRVDVTGGGDHGVSP